MDYSFSLEALASVTENKIYVKIYDDTEFIFEGFLSEAEEEFGDDIYNFIVEDINAVSKNRLDVQINSYNI